MAWKKLLPRKQSAAMSLTSDDMDFISGNLKVIGSGNLTIKAKNTVWSYKIGTAAETVA